MENKDCLYQLTCIETAFAKAYNDLKCQRTKERASVLNQWAKDNSPYQVGDIIQCNDRIIQIEKVIGAVYLEDLYCNYHGIVLTKQLKPKKDGSHATIFGDNKNITLLKKNS